MMHDVLMIGYTANLFNSIFQIPNSLSIRQTKKIALAATTLYKNDHGVVLHKSSAPDFS
jgi:hypothetical protein